MQYNRSSSGSYIRPTTAESYRHAVERVIVSMLGQLDQPMSLKELAKVAIISPFHFDRIFRQMTGIPPCQFLGALRIQQAKRLLLTTRLQVTDICFEVGYNSLGSFLTRFNQLVGLTPRRLRRQAEAADKALRQWIEDHKNDSASADEKSAGLSGNITGPDSFKGVIFMGLFPTRIPQSKPEGCTALTAPGTYHIAPVRDGSYYLLAVAFPLPNNSVVHLLTENKGLFVAASTDPVVVKDGEVCGNVDLELRPLELMDPPILMIPPLMLNSWLEEIKKLSNQPVSETAAAAVA